MTQTLDQMEGNGANGTAAALSQAAQVGATDNISADIDTITRLLASDTGVKVAGIDFDGVLRGKIMSKEKFLASLKGGFGMSSAIFGWDMPMSSLP